MIDPMPHTSAMFRFGVAPTVATDRYWARLSLLLAIVLLAASTMKAAELWTLAVDLPGFLGRRWVRIAAIEVEIVTAVWLVSGLFPQGVWRATIAVWTTFACVAAVGVWRGESSCSCFGAAVINPAIMLSMDAAIIVAILLCKPTGTRSLVARRVISQSAAIVIVATWVAWNAAMLMRSTSESLEPGFLRGDDAVVLDPIQWVGRRFILADSIDVGNVLLRGQWLCLLYRLDCVDCQAALAKYTQIAAETGQPIALIEIPSLASTSVNSNPVPPSAVRAKLSPSYKWFAATPVAFRVNKGIVTGIEDRTAPVEASSSFSRSKQQGGI